MSDFSANEGLFVSLSVSLDTLEKSLDQATNSINSTVKEIEKSIADVGKNTAPTQAPLEKTKEKIKDVEKETSALGETFKKVFGVDANKILGKFGTSLEDVTKFFTSPAGLIGGITAIGKKLIDFGKQFDEVSATIAKGTGATGTKLKEFNQVLMNVGKTGLEQSFEEAGAALAEINTQFDLTGKELEATTSLFAVFSDVVGQNMTQSVKDTSALMKKWGIDIKDTESLLDKLTVAGQTTGVNVSALSNQLTNSAAQFQAVGYGIDESIALLASFEKQGVKTESVVSGINKAIGYFSERNVNAAEGMRVVIDKIKNTADETEALSVATNVFGTKTGVEFANAIRSGKLALDDYINVIKNANGAIAKTDEASNTLEDRLAVLGNSLKAKFEPVGTGFVNLAKALLDQLIPAITSTGGETAELKKTQTELETNTNNLKTSIYNYESANKALNDTTLILNETEKATLKGRKELYGLEITANIAKTVKSIEEMQRKTDKLSESLKGNETQEKNTANTVNSLSDRLNSLVTAQNKGIKTIDDYNKSVTDNKLKWYEYGLNIYSVDGAIKNLQLRLTKQGEQLALDTTRLNQNNLALAESKEKRQETINELATAINLGQIQIGLIERYNKEIAKEVQATADKLKNDKKINEEKKQTTNLTYEQIEASKKKKENDDKLAQMELENSKRLIDNKIELLEFERKQEIEAANKLGADISKINKFYDKQIAEERAKYEIEYLKKSVDDKIALLKEEKRQKMDEAKSAGANTFFIEQYYDKQIAEETEKANKEITEANRKKFEEMQKQREKYAQSEIEKLAIQAQTEIELARMTGENVALVTEFWQEKIREATKKHQNDLKKKHDDAKQKFIDNEKKKTDAAIELTETIVNGSINVINKFDEKLAENAGKLASVGVGIAKLIASEGGDAKAWVDVIVNGIDLIIQGLQALGQWWDVNINKISKLEEYSKYVFENMKKSVQQDLGDSFKSAFENGIKPEELQKIIGKKLLKIAIDAALFAAGMDEKLKIVTDKIQNAIKSGFDPAALTDIKNDVQSLYDTTNNILQPLADNINSVFGLIEEQTKSNIVSFADYVATTWQEASKGFIDNVSGTFTSAFVEGFDLTELKKKIGEQLLQVAVESALMTIGFKDKMEELGKLVAAAIESGFTAESLDALDDKIEQIYNQAANVITPITSMIGEKFGTGARENFGSSSVTNNTTTQSTGITVNQDITFTGEVKSTVETKRAIEEANKNSFFDAGIVA